MIEIIKKSNLDYFKVYIFFYIMIIPWDLFNSMKSILSGVLLIWWITIGKKNDYFSNFKDIFYNKPILIFIIFYMYMYLSLLWSDNYSWAFKELKLYTYWILIVPILFSVLKREDIRKIFISLTFSFGLYSLYSILVFIGLIKMPEVNGHINYATVTVYVAFNTILSFYLFFSMSKESRFKYIFLIISIVSFFAILIQNGRIGQISFFGTLFVLMIYYRKYLFEYKRILASFVLIIIFAILFLNYLGKTDRYIKGYSELVSSIETKEFNGSWGPRAYMWYVAMDTIPKNILFGSGIGDTRDKIIKFNEQTTYKLQHHLIGYHNQHLDYIASLGILGYGLFLASILVLLRNLYEENKEMLLIGLAFFSIVIIDGFGDVIIAFKPFTNVYAIIFVLLAIATKKPSKRSSY
ncbi:O-Antigen ligase [Aliarcobacter thereius]|uniref:O-antigen ligase family protein n=1 Tax=Aliarcobacter thereius TaxID=544718 RepID=UPI000827584C|nr:O-antigen ligase family protein [Aliarcobacter thereius]OCL87902.1 O-Antigen ligase [Aliarcobacter thereius]TLT08335.1 O-antigen ligase family protein [Aliarcobacter thereius]